MNMKKVSSMVLFAAAMILGGRPVLATTFAVGTCRPMFKSFSTISAAVASVPAGSIVEVCPGTYPEQVTISTPLTLLGAASGNVDRATIVVPRTGLIANASSSFAGGSVGAQIAVTTGPVTIEGITVDGTGVPAGAPFDWLVGIFYGNGAFGNVEGVTVRNEILQNINPRGAGIWAENENGSVLTVRVTDNSVYNADYAGIFVASSSSNENGLRAIVEFNDIDAGSWGALSDSGGNVVANNVVADASLGGIWDGLGQGSTITGNTVIGSVTGILTDGNGAVESNVVWLTGHIAIAFLGGELNGGAPAISPGAIKVNRILDAATAITFGCGSETVTDNVINDVGTALGDAPSSFNQFNNIVNADTIRNGGCPLQ